MPRFLVLFTLLLVVVAPVAAQEALDLLYAANEGVLITVGERKILIDALFDAPNPAYRAPEEGTLVALESGRPPFDGIDLALVTHLHPDHFDPACGARFLAGNPGTILVAPADAAAALREARGDGDDPGSRIVSLDLAPGELGTVERAGIAVRAHRTLHSGGRETPQNLMYLCEIGGWRVFHEGDSSGDPQVFRDFGLGEERIDLALVHFWFPLRENGVQILEEILRPAHVGLMHLPVEWEADAPATFAPVRKTSPHVFLLRERGERRTIPPRR